MGKMDPEYDKAKHGFLRELSQFHQSRGSKFKGISEVNGQEVDVYLLYQIVTSHGGWEKINVRNEWDDLLEHFNLPRSTNGGLILKNIYLKYLELYEKIHYLGEDVDGRHDDDDEYDDFRYRRRYNQYTTPNKPAAQATSTTPLYISTIPVTESNMAQLGMSTRRLEGGDYDRLLMSLQSPLPNDQDMAISVCTLLSNETKHVLKFPKAPRILELLLGHAGVFNHCKLRELLENSYLESRQLCHNSFWMETVPEGHARHVLCECFVQKVNYSVGAEAEYLDFTDTDVVYEPEMTEEEKWILMNRKRISEYDPDASVSDCCRQCPCKGVKSQNPSDPFPALNQEPQPLYLLRKTAYSDDRIGQRITQIANILRNLSFEEENALLMANNQTLLRFILLSSECSWGTIPQLALDLLGNIAQHLQLREPSIDPLSCRIMSLVLEGLYSSDRFRILRSLESLREMCKKEGNDEILNRYVKLSVYKRICELLTISDIMLLIYTLECLLSMTGLGEAVCNELSRVQGSVATLVSLVTVEAQSYGPKGCILMRVVETVTGNLQPQTQPGGTAQSSGAAVLSSQMGSPVSNHVAPSNSPSTVIAPTVTIPRASPSPVPSFPSSALLPSLGSMNKATSVNLPSSSTSMVSNPLHSSTVNHHPSALQVQLQQPSAVSMSHHTAASSISSQHMKVPSPALSPSSSLSPAPSPGPPPGPMAHFVQSTTQSHFHSPASALQKPNINGASELSSTPTNFSSGLNMMQTAAVSSATYSNFSTSRNISTTPTSSVFSTSSGHASSTTSGSSLPVFSTAGGISGGTTSVIISNAGTCPSSTNTASLSTMSQVSNQSLNQQLIIPSISLPLVTPKGTLSEEGWALAWLKGAFEVFPGQSIEQGESYRMYCSARKNPQKILSIDQFIQCVKCAYGTPVGPVIKNFGSSSLSFFEGIRPKIISKPTLATPPVATNSVTSIANPLAPAAFTHAKTVSAPTVSVAVSVATPTLSPGISVEVRPTIPSSTAPLLNPIQVNQVPVSVHIPSNENKTLSPILKATLSRPPKPKNPSGVAQRQQKKLQLESLPKKSKKGLEGKINGIDGNLEMEESSASSSVNSNEDQEGNAAHRIPAVAPQITSFQGILRNGLSSEESSKDGDGTTSEDFLEGKKLKGMLIDLLERKVNPIENPNGLGNREIRISDRGLELVDKLDENNSNSSMSSGPAVVVNMKSSSMSGTVSATLLDPNDSQQSQMTFYSAPEPQVTLFSQVVSPSLAKYQNLNKTTPCTNIVTTGDGSVGGGVGGGVILSSSSSAPTTKVSDTVLMSSMSGCSSTTRVGGNKGVFGKNNNNLVVVGSGGDGNSGNGNGNNNGVVSATETKAMSGSPALLQLHHATTLNSSQSHHHLSSSTTTSATTPTTSHPIINIPAADLPTAPATTTTSSCSSSSSSNATTTIASIPMDGDDLLEKFNEISDLIVVPPEQLGIKRPHFDESSTGSSPGPEPPVKKSNNNVLVNGNGYVEGISTAATAASDGNVKIVGTTGSSVMATVASSVMATVASSSSSIVTATPSVLQASLASFTSAPLVNAVSSSTSTLNSHIVFTTTTSSSSSNNMSNPIKSLASGTPVSNSSVVTVGGSLNSNHFTPIVSTSTGPTTNAPNQMMQVRLLNPQNQQLTFARQLVLPSGQQLILSTAKSQNQLQGQVIISKPHVSSNDQMAKAIIILQPSSQQQHQHPAPQQQQSQIQQQLQQPPMQSLSQHQQQHQHLQHTQLQQPQQQVQHQNQQSHVQQQTSVPQTSVVQQQQQQSQLQQQLQLHPHQQLQLQQQHQQLQQLQQHQQQQQQQTQASASPLIQSALQQQVQAPLSSGITIRPIRGHDTPLLSSLLPDGNSFEQPYLCEWTGCGQRFSKPGKVFLHVSKVHTPETLTEAVRCEWGPNGCDPLLRKRLSLMTHLQDRHCTKHALEMSLYRRRNKIEAPPPPQHPTHHHLGYAPNAAFHAIKRHAMQFMNPKELLDDNEGPVTKSIRLTAALILKNLVNYSSMGRKILRGYESQLATIAMSNVESSRTIAQLLYDMKEINSS